MVHFLHLPREFQFQFDWNLEGQKHTSNTAHVLYGTSTVQKSHIYSICSLVYSVAKLECVADLGVATLRASRWLQLS